MTETRRKPNVLVIVVDCLRADMCAGPARHVRTPALDALRQQGTYFAQAIANATTTTPSMATLLTGLYPFRHGVRALEGHRLGTGYPTVAEVLRENGYFTVAEVTGPLLPLTGLDRGFDEFHWRPEEAYLDTRWGDSLRRRLAARSPRAPWFLFLHLWEAHWPRYVPRRYRRDEFGRNQYERAISALDEQLGTLLATLDLRDTVVLLTGDHGERISPLFDSSRPAVQLAMSVLRAGWTLYRDRIEHRLPRSVEGAFSVRQRTGRAAAGHGYHVYEFLIRVPLLAAGAGVFPARTTVEHLVQHVDVAPTLLACASVTPPVPLDGRSVVPLAYGLPAEEVIGYTEASNVLRTQQPEWLAGLRTERLKYVYAPENPAVAEELYNLEHDPDELHNVAPSQRLLAAELRGQLQAMLGAQTVGSTPLASQDEALMIEHLTALGYLE